MSNEIEGVCMCGCEAEDCKHFKMLAERGRLRRQLEVQAVLLDTATRGNAKHLDALLAEKDKMYSLGIQTAVESLTVLLGCVREDYAPGLKLAIRDLEELGLEASGPGGEDR